jgi:hypothetical protein
MRSLVWTVLIVVMAVAMLFAADSLGVFGDRIIDALEDGPLGRFAAVVYGFALAGVWAILGVLATLAKTPWQRAGLTLAGRIIARLFGERAVLQNAVPKDQESTEEIQKRLKKKYPVLNIEVPK